MGLINRFDLTRIIREYHTPYFFETGTWKGDAVAYALESPFTKIISIEIIPEIAIEAGKRFLSTDKVKIIEGNSVDVMAKELPKLNGNCVFWLDAHFPGADAGMTDYDAIEDEETRLPLAKEVEIIKTTRAGFNDVLIIDDLRIYEDGPYQNGLVPPNAMPGGARSISFVYQYFETTHYIFKSFLDEGYILLFPKKSYNRNHFKLSGLFKKKPVVADHYLLDKN
jgi:hypothetical protein